jgi:ketosteroid isomerase-like protein
MLYAEILSLGRRLHSALSNADWTGIRPMLADDIRWVLPASTPVAAEIRGVDKVLEHFRVIAGFGVAFSVTHVLVRGEKIALSLHNCARRGQAPSGDPMATVCRLTGGKIDAIETYPATVRHPESFFG